MALPAHPGPGPFGELADGHADAVVYAQPGAAMRAAARVLAQRADESPAHLLLVRARRPELRLILAGLGCPAPR
eukprot:11164693-Lingulodinium_polyedra.AAC.1